MESLRHVKKLRKEEKLENLRWIGERKYIDLDCDDVMRGYGKKGKLNPKRRMDKKRHERELKKRYQSLEEM